jgi:energy-coupling factor transport system ATP-binding protein
MVKGFSNFAEKIVVESLKFSYNSSGFSLKNINLKIKENEFVLLTGASGSGKSTLLYCITGIIPHYIRNGKISGNIWVNGKNTRETPLEELAKEVGIVLQNPESQIFGMTVEEDIAFGLENACIPRQQIGKKINEILNFLELEKFREKPPESLSGGQKQRLVIGSVVALQPEILVFDEPFSNLDPWGVNLVVSTLKKLKKAGKTILLAERRIEEVIHLADRIVVLENGKIIADKHPREFFANRKLVEKSKINIPQVVRLAYGLESKGIRFERFPLSVREVLEELDGYDNKN